MEQFDLYGITRILTDQTKATEFAKQLEKYDHNRGDNLPENWRYYWIESQIQLGELLDQIFYETGWQISSMCAKIEQEEQQWCRYYPYGFEIEPITRVNGVQIIVALDEFTSLNGAPEMLCNSHKKMIWDGHGQLCQLIGPPGAIFVCHAATLHRSGVNWTGTRRATLLINIVSNTTNPQCIV